MSKKKPVICTTLSQSSSLVLRQENLRTRNWLSEKALLSLLPVGAAISQTADTTGGLAENGSARTTEDDSLSMGEDGGDAEAAGALHIHEVAVGGLNQAGELVLAALVGGLGVEQIVFQHHCYVRMNLLIFF